MGGSPTTGFVRLGVCCALALLLLPSLGAQNEGDEAERSSAERGSAERGSAERGSTVLQENGCTRCHLINGRGAGDAPDLGRLPSRNLDSASLTALLWNHGPRMWLTMQARGMEIPKLPEQTVEDLYAYYRTMHFLDLRGDAKRGEQVFIDKHCAECHSLAKDAKNLGFGGALPVSAWPSTADPSLWAEAMWNHSEQMADGMRQKGIAWPRFETQEMTDLWLFLREQPNSAADVLISRFGSPTRGEAVFRSQRCRECHTLGTPMRGRVDLNALDESNRSLPAFAASMWNHRPRVTQLVEDTGGAIQPLERGQMADLLGFLTSRGHFDPQGDAERGAVVFRRKGCQSCHSGSDAGAPKLSGRARPYSPARLAASVWRHGPDMMAKGHARNRNWPQLTGRDVVNLIAHLNSQ